MPRYQTKIQLHKAASDAVRHFGLNPFGDPRYRVVFSDSRMRWSNGEYAPKYSGIKGGWVLEKYREAERYGDPVAWEGAGLGPFPYDGDYELCQSLKAWGDDICRPEALKAVVDAAQRSDELNDFARQSMFKEEQERKEKERRSQLEAMVADARPLRGGEAERKHAEKLEEDAKKLGFQVPVIGASLSTGA